jgi:hypothetical protein
MLLEVNQEGLKLNGTHQLLDCADDVNLLGQNLNTVKKNTETLLGTRSRCCKIYEYVHIFSTDAGQSHKHKGSSSNL